MLRNKNYLSWPHSITVNLTGEDYDFGATVAEPVIYIDTEDSGTNKQYLAGTRIRTKRDVKSFKGK